MLRIGGQMMFRKQWAIFLLRSVVLALSFASAVFAQTAGTATLVGTVTDSSGLVVPNAKVSVVNVDTAFLSETVTTAEGFYNVPYLAPGIYRLTVEAGGFKRHVR